MIIKNLRSYWDYGNRYAGIEVTSKGDGLIFHAVTCRGGRDGYTDFVYRSYTNAEIPRKGELPGHAWAVLNSDRVLIKKTGRESKAERAIGMAFPGIRQSDFYLEVVQGSGATFVLACRRDEADWLIGMIEALGVNVVGFRLGLAPLTSIVEILKEEQVNVSNRTVKIEDGMLLDLSVNQSGVVKSYDINGESVESSYLLPLSVLSNYNGSPSELLEGANNLLLKKYSESNFFKKGLVTGVVLLLAVFLLNMLFYTSYFSKVENLKQEMELASSQRENLARRTGLLENRERVVRGLLTTGNSKGGYYINRLVASMPSGLVLSEATYQPLVRAIREDKPIEFRMNVIKVSGESNDGEIFNRWMQRVDGMEWTGKITVDSYGSSDRGKENFVITIEIDASEK